jgi:hypothetical protein
MGSRASPWHKDGVILLQSSAKAVAIKKDKAWPCLFLQINSRINTRLTWLIWHTNLLGPITVTPDDGLFHAIFLAEFLDTPCRINNLLLAGIKRMAGRTDFHMQILVHGRAGGKLVATTAGNLNFIIAGMDIGFHIKIPSLDFQATASHDAAMMRP